MAYHSNGAFDFQQVYNMPVYLRNFYMKQLEDVKKKEADAVKTTQSRNRQPKR